MNGSVSGIELWFDFGSNYSYLSVMRIRAAAARYGVNIVWQPFLLGPIFKSFGWETSPFLLQKEKGAYMWKDMARQCVKYGLPWTRPSAFPRFALLAQRVALLGAREPWIGDFCERLMLMNFAEDRDIGSQDAVTKALERLGLDAGSLVAAAQTAENKQRLRDQTEAARARGIFGAPTFFARGEMFWGNDRLDDALAFAARAV